MNNNTRTLLGLFLIVMALFYKGCDNIPNPITPPKLPKPNADIINLVDTLYVIPDKVDANKVAAIFYAMSKRTDVIQKFKNNLNVQYYLDFVGKNTVGTELKNNDSPKYPEFAPSAAALITKVIGPQDEELELTDVEKKKLGELFYGIAWKLYNKDEDAVFEQYKTKAKAAIAKYNNDEPEPKPEPKPDDGDCPCDGSGWVTHADGHKTPCPCLKEGSGCVCKSTLKKKNKVIETQNESVSCEQGSCSTIQRTQTYRRPLLRLFGR